MAPDRVGKRGRGFSDVAPDSVLSADPTGPTAGRLDRPAFLDEEDVGVYVEAARLGPDFPRTTPNKQPNEKVNLPPTTAMSQKEEPRTPKPERCRPGHERYKPPPRRGASMPDHVVADQPGGVSVDFSKMDFSNVDRETQLNTLEQTGWPLDQALKAQKISMTDDHRQSQTFPHRKPTKGRRPPRPYITPNRVPNEALKFLPTRDTLCKDQKPAIMAKELATRTSPKLPQGPVSQAPPPIIPIATGSIIPDKIQKKMLTTKQETPVSPPEVIEIGWAQETRRTVTPSKESFTEQEIVEAEQAQEIEENFPSSTEGFEPYHLAPDERFASESSAESESVTSTIYDYEDISQSDGGESDEEGSEPVKKRKPRRKQAIETSDGKVYYPISESEETYVPLSFQIPNRELIRLVSMKEGSKMRVWNHNLYVFGDKKIDVEYCTTFEEFEAAARRFSAEKVIGFDMEWLARPSKKVWDNVSLIQMAKEDYIVLFHIARLKKENVDEFIPPSLRLILESRDILKTGVHIGGDGGRIKKWLGIDVQGLMELNSIHHLVEYARERRRGTIPKVLVSLSKLCEQYLKLPIDKGFVRISDWTKPLTPNQISYAATDAYAGFRLFDCLQQARMNINPIPMLPTCVKKSDGEKKKRVVTPKGGGATPISTWDTQTTYDVALGTALGEQSSEVQDWAQEVEDSKVEIEVAPAPPVKTKRRYNRRSTAARAAVNVEFAGNEKKATQSTPRRQGPPQAPMSPERQFAEGWAKENHVVGENGSRVASISELRAYALWHKRGFSVEDTAKHLSVLPKTAAQYIRQAVWHNKLDCERERLDYVWSLSIVPPYRKGRQRNF